jgi:uncharacterized protein (DUF4415 family)
VIASCGYQAAFAPEGITMSTMNTATTTTTSAIVDLPTLAPRSARPVKRKTRITIYLDDEVLSQFRSLSEQSGKGYQTLINAALRSRLSADPILA